MNVIQEVARGGVAIGSFDCLVEKAGLRLTSGDNIFPLINTPSVCTGGKFTKLGIGAVDWPYQQRNGINTGAATVGKRPEHGAAWRGCQLLVERGCLIGIDFGKLLTAMGRNPIKAILPDLNLFVSCGCRPAFD